MNNVNAFYSFARKNFFSITAVIVDSQFLPPSVQINIYKILFYLNHFEHFGLLCTRIYFRYLDILEQNSMTVMSVIQPLGTVNAWQPPLYHFI